MLANRIIATLLIRDGILVKGKRFVNERRVGSVRQTVEVMQLREIDEMVLLDIDATREGRTIDAEFVQELSDACYMPLAFGGGIRTIEDARRLFNMGADKIVIGAAGNDIDFIGRLARMYGSQAVSITVDYTRMVENGSPVVGGNVPAVEYCKRLEDAGAGEIILQSIERDGVMCGYDTETIREVSETVNLPVVASGGAGEPVHFADALQNGAHACSAGALWQFTHHTPITIKRHLREKGFTVRL